MWTLSIPRKTYSFINNKSFKGESIPIYGDGQNIRDWIFVEDHIDAILCVAKKGKIGQTYCIGGNCEKSNKELINIICQLLNEIVPNTNPYSNLIKYVEDRPGHDFRYSINNSFIKEIGWEPKTNIIDGLKNY